MKTDLAGEMIEEYFEVNRDNPYAIENFLSSLTREIPFRQVTQFPPLASSKTSFEHRQAVKSLAEAAEPGDVLFSSSSASRISALIRRYDRSQWSHVAGITSSRTIADVGPGGIVENSFDSLLDPSISAALYRLRGTSQEQRALAAAKFTKQIGTPGYNWYGVARLFLRNRFSIPYRQGVSVSDLIRSNQFDLVSFV